MTRQLKTDKTLAAMMRALFHSFVSGVADASGSTRAENCSPAQLKRLLLPQYEHIADVFHQEMLPVVVRLNYRQLSDFTAQAERLPHPTYQQLMQTACREPLVYEMLIAEYRRNFEELLAGHLSSVAQHLSHYTRQPQPSLADADLSVMLTVRLIVRSYAQGLAHAATGKASLHQPTLLQLLADHLSALLHSDDRLHRQALQAQDIHSCLRTICQTESCYNVAVNELHGSMRELISQQRIVADNDIAN